MKVTSTRARERERDSPWSIIAVRYLPFPCRFVLPCWLASSPPCFSFLFFLFLFFFSSLPGGHPTDAHPPCVLTVSRIFVTLIITCSRQFQATGDFLAASTPLSTRSLALPREHTHTHIYARTPTHTRLPIYQRGHLLAAVLNVVIHDSRGATSHVQSPLGIRYGQLISESVIDVVGFSAPIYFYALLRRGPVVPGLASPGLGHTPEAKISQGQWRNPAVCEFSENLSKMKFFLFCFFSRSNGNVRDDTL